MVMIVLLWLSICSLRWTFQHHVIRVSRPRPLLGFWLSMFGFISGYHDPLFHIGIAISLLFSGHPMVSDGNQVDQIDFFSSPNIWKNISGQ
jgi:hypothetical protein